MAMSRHHLGGYRDGRRETASLARVRSIRLRAIYATAVAGRVMLRTRQPSASTSDRTTEPATVCAGCEQPRSRAALPGAATPRPAWAPGRRRPPGLCAACGPRRRDSWWETPAPRGLATHEPG